jgi:hypothetical protein
MSLNRLGAALFICTSLLIATPAMDDVIDPAEDACSGKAKGASCDSGQAGTCQDGECCRNDYSNGPPPTTVCSPCLVCKPGAAPATDPADEPEKTGTGEPPAAKSGGCASTGAGSLGMWSILGGLGALGALRRKKRLT